MSARRLLATAAALACAALSLTACGPDDPTPAGAAPTAPARTSAPGTAPSTPATAPTASAKPAADCTANAVEPGHRVIVATAVGHATSVWMKALDTKFVCGPDIPNDGYFQGYGTPQLYSFSNDVKTGMLADMKTKSLELNTFMKLAGECLATPNSMPQPYQCYGNSYDVTVNSKNVITSINELYHP
ncbi:hypothetical protein [Kitasatospora mediocidica]|uniref:hypothetical protein n=1 Tax=Kitasatospora mediocidica TaxID=58352 RepID=UPI00056CE1D0|nr:hypothetical protein [Kitasatospora mediocidica]